MISRTIGAFGVEWAAVAFPVIRDVGGAFRIFLVVPCLTALPTASFVDAGRSMMTPPKAVSTLAGSSVPEDVAVELFESDLDGTFFYLTAWVDEFPDILFARHYDFQFSRIPVCSARVRGSCDRGYRGDFDS